MEVTGPAIYKHWQSKETVNVILVAHGVTSALQTPLFLMNSCILMTCVCSHGVPSDAHELLSLGSTGTSDDYKVNLEALKHYLKVHVPGIGSCSTVCEMRKLKPLRSGIDCAVCMRLI